MNVTLGLAVASAFIAFAALSTSAVAAPVSAAEAGSALVLEAKSSKASRPAKRKSARPYCSPR